MHKQVLIELTANVQIFQICKYISQSHIFIIYRRIHSSTLRTFAKPSKLSVVSLIRRWSTFLGRLLLRNLCVGVTFVGIALPEFSRLMKDATAYTIVIGRVRINNDHANLKVIREY